MAYRVAPLRCSICDPDFDADEAGRIAVFLNGERVIAPVEYDCGKGEVWTYEIDCFGQKVIDRNTGLPAFERHTGLVTAVELF
jgi:hypothetical protein